MLIGGRRIFTGDGLLEMVLRVDLRYFFCFQAIHVLLPFHRECVLFFCIACLAAGDKVVFSGTAATGQGDDMVHGQIFKADLFVTVITCSRAGFLLPPAGFTQGPGLVSFRLDTIFVRAADGEVIITHGYTSSPSRICLALPTR